MGLFAFWQVRDLSEDEARALAFSTFKRKDGDQPEIRELPFSEAVISHRTVLSLFNKIEFGTESAARARGSAWAVDSAGAGGAAEQALDRYASDKRVGRACRRILRAKKRRVLERFATGQLLRRRGRSQIVRKCDQCIAGVARCQRCWNTGGPRRLAFGKTCGRCGGTGKVTGQENIFTLERTTGPIWGNARHWQSVTMPCPNWCLGETVKWWRRNPNYCPACKGRRRPCPACKGTGSFVTPVSAVKMWAVESHETRETNAPRSGLKRRSDLLAAYGGPVTVGLRRAPKVEGLIESESKYGYWRGRIVDSCRTAHFEICGREIQVFDEAWQKYPYDPQENPLASLKLPMPTKVKAPERNLPDGPYMSVAVAVGEFLQRMARLLGG